MKELLTLALPTTIFIYAVAATVAADRQYRRAERFKVVENTRRNEQSRHKQPIEKARELADAAPFKALRVALELALVVLVVFLTLLAVNQKQTIDDQNGRMEQLVRDKLALIQDYQALREEANLPSSGGY